MTAAVASGSIRTTTGVQSFTVSGFGTPQAAIIFLYGCMSGTNPRDGIMLSIGYTDGTTHGTTSIAAVDNVSTSDTGRYSDATNPIVAIEVSGTDSAITVGAFSQWVTDGIELNFTTVDANAYYIDVVLLKGYAGVKCFSKLLNASGVTSVTGLGITPTHFIGSGIGEPSLGHAGQGVFCFGASDFTTNACVLNYNQNTQTTMAQYGVTQNNACIGEMASTVSWRGIAENPVSGGFDFNVNSGTPSGYVIGLAIQSTDEISIDVISSPTSTGNYAVTAPNIRPSAVILAMNACATINTVESDDDGGVLGFSVFDGTTSAFGGITEDDGATTTNNQTNHSATAVALKKWGGSSFDAFYTGTLSSLDATGYTINMSAVDATARQWLSIAFKDANNGSGSLTFPDFTLTGYEGTAGETRAGSFFNTNLWWGNY